MKQYRCGRCGNVFERKKKYKHTSTWHICDDCKKPHNTNKGKSIITVYERIGIKPNEVN